MTIGKLSEWFVAKDSPPTLTIRSRPRRAHLEFDRRLFRLPEAYWAPITTLVVMQTTLHLALPFSAQYFAGTAVGALAGAFIDHYFPASIWALAQELS